MAEMIGWDEMEEAWYGQVPVPVFADESLSPLDVKIYAIVSLRTANKGARVLSEAEVARLARCHKETAGTSLRKLRDAGYLAVRGTHGGPLAYEIRRPGGDLETGTLSVTKRNSDRLEAVGGTASGLVGGSVEAVGGTAQGRLGASPQVVHIETRDFIRDKETIETDSVEFSGSHFEGSAPDQGAALDPSTPIFVSAETLNHHIDEVPEWLWDNAGFSAAFERWQRMGDWKAGIFRNTYGGWVVEDDHRAKGYPTAPHQEAKRF